jgi:3-hydroxypropanoate dehydrogenase
MSAIINDTSLNVIFRTARTHSVWLDKLVSDVTLEALYDLLRMGPTSANSSPARFIFLTTPEAKERLRPHLSAGNLEKTMSAPVTAIVAYDMRFTEKLGKLFPHEPSAPSWFEGDDEKMFETAFRNGSLQGAYMIVAARALGLDCGPMSGFNADGVNSEFFPDGRFRTNFLCNLGYGDPAALPPRNPRLDFDEACQVL